MGPDIECKPSAFKHGVTDFIYIWWQNSLFCSACAIKAIAFVARATARVVQATARAASGTPGPDAIYRCAGYGLSIKVRPDTDIVALPPEKMIGVEILQVLK